MMTTHSKWQQKLYSAGSAVVLAALLAGCSGSTDNAPKNTATEVGVQIIRTQDLAVSKELAGRINALMESDVRPQVGGIIQKRLFTEGDFVKEGQPLYQLDAKLFQAAYNTAKGDLAKAQAALLSARPKAARYQRLLAIDAVSKQDAADAQASLKEYEAAVVSAQGALDTARTNLAYTVIRAPISGVIGTSAVTPGALVTADQTTALATIRRLDPLYVDINMSSAQLLELKKQLIAGSAEAVTDIPVSITLEDGSVYGHQGLLHFVGTSVDEGTGTVTLRATVPNPQNLLLPGSYVRAKLPMSIDKNAILIPQTAVTRNHHGDAVVKLVNAQNKVVEQIVQTSGTQGNQWVVSGGLKAGDKLIVEGGSKANAGSSAKITAQNNGVSAASIVAVPAPASAVSASAAQK